MPILYDDEFIATFKQDIQIVNGEANLYNQISYNIMERLEIGDILPININGLFCLEGNTLIYYWFEDNGQITQCMELTKKPYSMILNGIGYLNNKSKIGDLYEQILDMYVEWMPIKFKNNNHPTPCIIFSENQLTENNIKMWWELLNKKKYYENENKQIEFLPKFSICSYEIKKIKSKSKPYFKTVEELYEHKNNSNFDEKWQYYIADFEYGFGMSSMIGKYGCRQEGIENAVNRNEI